MFKRLKDKIVFLFKKNTIKLFDREVINLKDIKIPKEFKKSYPGKSKMKERWNYFNKYKEPKVPMIVNENNVLIDGYTSYLISKKIGAVRVSVKRV